MFGNPSVLTQCTLGRLRAHRSARRRAGRADHRPRQLRRQSRTTCSARRRSTASTGRRRGGPLRLHRADPEHPDRDPGQRPLRPTDYRLRFTVSGITQLAPLAAADLTFWGFPGGRIAIDANASPKGSPGNPPGARVRKTPSASPNRRPPACPTALHRQPLGLRRGSAHDPEMSRPTRARGRSRIDEARRTPRSPNCDRQTFKPVAQAKLTTTEADSPSGIDLIVKAPQPQSKAASPSQVRTVILSLPEGLTINPDAADGQSRLLRRRRRLGTEAPAHCPDNAKIGTITISSAALPNDLEGAIYFGEPKPGSQYRLLIIADGYGIQDEVPRRSSAGSEDGADQRRLRRPSAASVRRIRDPPLRLRPRRPRDADPLRDPHHGNRPLPLEQPAPGPEIAVRGPDRLRSRRRPLPGGKRGPSTRGSRPEPRTRRPAASATSSSSSTATTATSSSATSTSRCRRA